MYAGVGMCMWQVVVGVTLGSVCVCVGGVVCRSVRVSLRESVGVCFCIFALVRINELFPIIRNVWHDLRFQNYNLSGCMLF